MNKIKSIFSKYKFGGLAVALFLSLAMLVGGAVFLTHTNNLTDAKQQIQQEANVDTEVDDNVNAWWTYGSYYSDASCNTTSGFSTSASTWVGGAVYQKYSSSTPNLCMKPADCTNFVPNNDRPYFTPVNNPSISEGDDIYGSYYTVGNGACLRGSESIEANNGETVATYWSTFSMQVTFMITNYPSSDGYIVSALNNYSGFGIAVGKNSNKTYYIDCIAYINGAYRHFKYEGISTNTVYNVCFIWTGTYIYVYVNGTDATPSNNNYSGKTLKVKTLYPIIGGKSTASSTGGSSGYNAPSGTRVYKVRIINGLGGVLNSTYATRIYNHDKYTPVSGDTNSLYVANGYSLRAATDASNTKNIYLTYPCSMPDTACAYFTGTTTISGFGADRYVCSCAFAAMTYLCYIRSGATLNLGTTGSYHVYLSTAIGYRTNYLVRNYGGTFNMGSYGHLQAYTDTSLSQIGLWNENSGTANITGGEITGTTSTSSMTGSAIHVGSGTVNISGGTIGGTSNTNNYPTISHRGGDLDISGGTIKSNGSSATRMAIYTSGGTLAFTSSSFSLTGYVSYNSTTPMRSRDIGTTPDKVKVYVASPTEGKEIVNWTADCMIETTAYKYAYSLYNNTGWFTKQTGSSGAYKLIISNVHEIYVDMWYNPVGAYAYTYYKQGTQSTSYLFATIFVCNNLSKV